MKDRKSKEYGIVSEVLAIPKEAPLWKWIVRSGLLMRNSWLVNSVLYNAAAWHGIVKDNTEFFSRVNESLLGGLVSAYLGCQGGNMFRNRNNNNYIYMGSSAVRKAAFVHLLQ